LYLRAQALAAVEGCRMRHDLPLEVVVGEPIAYLNLHRQHGSRHGVSALEHVEDDVGDVAGVHEGTIERDGLTLASDQRRSVMYLTRPYSRQIVARIERLAWHPT
jgi:hypothetical protein